MCDVELLFLMLVLCVVYEWVVGVYCYDGC